MCDVLNRERIFRIVDLEKELGNAIIKMKQYRLKNKMEKIKGDFV